MTVAEIGHHGTTRGSSPLIWLVLAASTLLGVAYALVVPHGVPYDEPSHWFTMTFYSQHWSLPRLGSPGVTYTAEHPPLAYVVGGLVVRAARGLGLSMSAQMTTVRLVFGLQLPASIWLLHRILRASGFQRRSALFGAALFGLAPISLAMFWSVQNDGLLIMICLAAILLAIRWSGASGGFDSVWHAAVVGLVVGAASLTRITAFWLYVALVLWVVGTVIGSERSWLGLRRVAGQVGALSLTAAAVCGWWFVHNLAVYGRFTPDRSHTGLPPVKGAGFHGVHTVGSMAWNVTTYLWVPSEYWRNWVQLTRPVQAAVVGGTALLVIFGFRGWVAVRTKTKYAAASAITSNAVAAPRPGKAVNVRLVVLVIVSALGGWAMLYIFVASFPSRIGALGLVVTLGLGGALSVTGLREKRSDAVITITAAVLIGLSVWLLTAVAGLPSVNHV